MPAIQHSLLTPRYWNRGGAAELVTQPLWLGDPPRWILKAWADLREHLVSANEGWDVWTEWYDGILRGGPINKALEEARVLIKPALWKQGPELVNAEIARVIWEHMPAPPALPVKLPAPIAFEAHDGVVELIDDRGSACPSSQAEVAWSVLRETLIRLREVGGGNAARLAPVLDSAIDAMGPSADTIDVIRSGMAGLELRAFAAVADKLLMEDSAALLKAASAQHALLLAQFDDWRAFFAALSRPLDEPSAEVAAAPDAADLRAGFADSGKLGATANARLVEAERAALPEAQAAGPVPSPEPETIRAFLRSMLAVTRTFAIDILVEYKKVIVKGFATTMAGGTAAVLVAQSDALLALAAKLPTEWGWIAEWLTWLRGLLA